MVRRVRWVYVCPSCGATTFRPRLGGPAAKVREPASLVDGRQYPSCRQVEQLCYWCSLDRWGEEGESCMVLPRKNASVGSSECSTSSALDAGPLRQHSELWAFLTAVTYEDGQKRQTGRLSLSFESGLLGLLLNDAETGSYAFLNGRNLDDLLAEAELRLTDGSLSWKVSKYPSRKSR